MKKFIFAVLFSACFVMFTAPAAQAEVSTNAAQEILVVYKAGTPLQVSTDLALVKIQKRILHLTKIIAKHDGLSNSSYVGALIANLDKVLAEGDYAQAAQDLDDTEARLRRYGLWEPEPSLVYIALADIAASTTNAPAQ